MSYPRHSGAGSMVEDVVREPCKGDEEAKGQDYGNAAGEQHLEGVPAGGICGGISPVDLAASLEKETKLR